MSTNGGGAVSDSIKGVQTEVKSPAKKTPDDFIFGKLLGEGSFSSVYLAKDIKTGKEFAIKVCDKQHIVKEKKAELIRREKEALSILSANRVQTTPFFVHLYATFQDSQRLYFVMTFGHGGEILKHLQKVGRFSGACTRFYCGELVQALRHLHDQRIVHRDLKPENILLNDKGHILITDFGSAKIITPSVEAESTITTKDTQETEQPNGNNRRGNGRARSHSFVGTAQYVSPEVLQGNYDEVGPAADLWALGCIIYQFLTGSPPFQAPNEFLIFQRILKLEYAFPDGFDVDAKDLVDRLLQVDWRQRLGVQDSQRYTSIQSHAFFNEIDFDKLYEEPPPCMVSDPNESGDSVTPRPAPKVQHFVPSDLEPGFNPKVMAERALKSEQQLPWENHTHTGDGDDSDDSTPDADSGSGSHIVFDEITSMDKLSLSGVVEIGTDDNENRSRVNRSKSIFPRDDQERQERLDEQIRRNSWHKAVSGNLILKQGLVNKRKGLFCRRRMLLLTEGPHLYYCDPTTKVVKGEIQWSSKLKPEAKDFKIFTIQTPNKSYHLEDPNGYALEWCKAISEVSVHTYTDESPVDELPKAP